MKVPARWFSPCQTRRHRPAQEMVKLAGLGKGFPGETRFAFKDTISVVVFLTGGAERTAEKSLECFWLAS